jgi:hypothetical protein
MVDHRAFFFLFGGFCLNPDGTSLPLLVLRFHVFLEFLQIDQAVFVSIPLVFTGSQILRHFVGIEEAVAILVQPSKHRFGWVGAAPLSTSYHPLAAR